MKKWIAVTIVLAATFSTQAQSRWGIRTGLNYDLNAIGLDEALATSQQIFEGDVQDNGYHLGVFGRQFLGDQLYLSGSLLYAKNIHFVQGTNVAGDVFMDRFDYAYLQGETSVGLRLLKLARAEAGVHYQGTVSSNAFTNTFETGAAGYNIGAGVDLWKLSLDLTYYSSFSDHVGVWNDIPLSYNRSQLLLSLGVKL